MLCLSVHTLRPGFPHFYYILGANLGSRLNGDVSVIGAFTEEVLAL